jgi:cyanophycin synthetase
LAHEFEEEVLLNECIGTAIRLAQESPLGETIDISSEWRRLVDMADDLRLGPSSRAILDAATARGIPYFRLNQGSLVQFGEGAYQRRTWTAETDATSAIAESIASDKQLTRSLLAAVGVNVPKGRSVANRDDAWLAALEVGLPVAVKPRNANHAVGVSLDLSDQEAVLAAYDWACQAGHTTDVLVEQFIRGDHHRLLVIGGEFAAASKGQREYIYGDGVHSVRQLVEILNSDPRRGENYTDQLQIVKLDDAASIALKKQDLDFDSVPEKDRQVLIFHVGDLVEDCTDIVHPQTKRVAILAAKTIGLDIAGMDVVATDISRPLTDQRGCIIEVNAGPSLTPHVKPLVGIPRPVGEAVLKLLYPENRRSKVPTLLFVGFPEVDDIAMVYAKILGKKGHRMGVATDRKKVTDDWPIERPITQYQSLLMHPELTGIALQSSLGRISEAGLPCVHAEIVVIPASLTRGLRLPHADGEALTAMATISHLIQDAGILVVLGEDSEAETLFASCFLDGIPIRGVSVRAFFNGLGCSFSQFSLE